MRPSRGMGIMNPDKFKKISPKKITRKDDPNEVDVYKKGGGIKSVDKLAKQAKMADSIGKKTKANKRLFAEGGESKVNEAGNYTKPGLRKRLFNEIKNSATQGTGAGQWSARKSQLLAKRYKAAGGGYK